MNPAAQYISVKIVQNNFEVYSYMLVNNVPKLLAIAISSGLVVFTAPRLNKALFEFLAAIAAVFTFITNPLIRAAWKPVL